MSFKYVWHYVHNLENFSGAAFQALGLAERLDLDGEFKCVVINKSKRLWLKKESQKGLVVYHLPSNLIVRIFTLLWLMVVNRVDLVHIHGYEDSIFFVAKLLAKKVLLKSTIISENFESLSKKRTRFFLKLVSRVEYNNALSSPIYKVNSKYGGRVGIIPNYIEYIESVGLCDKSNTFVVLGVIASRKRTYEAIKFYIDILSAQFSDASLLVVGPYDDTYGEYDAGYVLKCLTLIEGRCDIKLVGQIPKSKVPELLRGCKGMLFFSQEEGFGSVIIEALSMSCVPLVCSDNEVAYDIVSDQVDGIFIGGFNQRVLREDIERIIDSGMLYEASKKYYVDYIVAEYLSVYRSILK